MWRQEVTDSSGWKTEDERYNKQQKGSTIAYRYHYRPNPNDRSRRIFSRPPRGELRTEILSIEARYSSCGAECDRYTYLDDGTQGGNHYNRVSQLNTGSSTSAHFAGPRPPENFFYDERKRMSCDEQRTCAWKSARSPYDQRDDFFRQQSRYVTSGSSSASGQPMVAMFAVHKQQVRPYELENNDLNMKSSLDQRPSSLFHGIEKNYRSDVSYMHNHDSFQEHGKSDGNIGNKYEKRAYQAFANSYRDNDADTSILAYSSTPHLVNSTATNCSWIQSSSSSSSFSHQKPPPSSSSSSSPAVRVATMGDHESSGDSKPATIELFPGTFLRLRGAEETLRAMDEGFIITCECVYCNQEICCIEDASYIICPDCRTVSPTYMDGGVGGIGLGYKGNE